MTSDGQLQLPPYPADPVSAIHNITIFLSSYVTGKNFTISNGTATNGSLGEIMQQENSSTVKHVNWVWPDCLVGDGKPSDSSSSRGSYNVILPFCLQRVAKTNVIVSQISIRQNFRLNNTDQYTIFDLPIQVTNSIPAQTDRSSCDALNNPLMTEAALNASASNFTRILGTTIQSGSNGQGLGGAGMLDWSTSTHFVWISVFVAMLAS